MGIGTSTNNTPSAVTTYPVNQYGEFTTLFAGHTYDNSFADTGSNGLFFGSPPVTLPDCTYPNNDWLCPSSTQSLTAVNTGALGSPSGSISFEIGNFINLAYTGKRVFRNIGGSPDFSGSSSFDWGLPFFLGRTVYIGIEGRSSILGTGPYIAY